MDSAQYFKKRKKTHETEWKLCNDNISFYYEYQEYKLVYKTRTVRDMLTKVLYTRLCHILLIW